MLEKLAPAFLAGLPTHREAGQPDGVPHRAGRTPDHRVRPPPRGHPPAARAAARPACSTSSAAQDSVAFTGSAAHRRRILRSHPPVLHGGVRLGVEADSLNCSILGPDVDRRRPGVRPVRQGRRHRDDRQGRPEVHRDPARDRARGDRRRRSSRRSPPGWPRSPSATPPTTTSGWARWRASTSARRSARRSRRCAAPPRSCSATPTTSTWSTPTPSAARSCRRSCCAPPPGAVEPHDVEPFGPVSTVLDLRRPRRGRRAGRPRQGQPGRLAGHPRPRRSPARSTLGLAPWHGRILVLDRDDAGESTGHGSPLPMLVHGGPGRAGGGEELGGIRGVLHHMQRTAIQASPDMLTAITGRWTTGSQRTDDRRAPVPQEPGRAARSATPSRSAPRTVTPRRHRALRGVHRRHLLRPHRRGGRRRRTRCSAASSPTATSSSRSPPACSSTPTPGPVLANFGVDNLRFLTPVKAGDSIAVTLTVKQITPRSERRLRRGPLGRGGHQRARASPWRRTTC